MARRWFVVAVVMVLAGSLACLAICSWLLLRMRTAAEQKRLVQEIRSYGGTVRYAYEYIGSVPQPSPELTSIFGVDFCADVTEVTFPAGTATDFAMRRVSDLGRLESLYVGGSPITDAGVEHVASVKKLTDLSLRGTCVTDAGMKSLSSLTRLRYLNLDQTNITDSGLAALEGLDELHVLSVCGTHVTEVGLARLGCLPKLGILTVTVGHDSGLDRSRLKRALPRCLIYGRDEKGATVLPCED